MIPLIPIAAALFAPAVISWLADNGDKVASAVSTVCNFIAALAELVQNVAAIVAGVATILGAFA